MAYCIQRMGRQNDGGVLHVSSGHANGVSEPSRTFLANAATTKRGHCPLLLICTNVDDVCFFFFSGTIAKAGPPGHCCPPCLFMSWPPFFSTHLGRKMPEGEVAEQLQSTSMTDFGGCPRQMVDDRWGEIYWCQMELLVISVGTFTNCQTRSDNWTLQRSGQRHPHWLPHG
jgi:hypothetical protein